MTTANAQQAAKPTSGVYMVTVQTPVHVGTGESAGAIDQPVMREKATCLPMLPGSAMKGGLRDATRPDPGPTNQTALAAWNELFGPEFSSSTAQQGVFMPEDARLLCLPAATKAGTLAWVTSPLLLLRLADALKSSGVTTTLSAASFMAIGKDKCCAAPTVVVNGQIPRPRVYVADLCPQPDNALNTLRQQWAKAIADAAFVGGSTGEWGKIFQQRFVVMSDDSLRHLTDQQLEVRSRVRREADGTVAEGALWFEEYLPEQTLLWGEWSLQPVLQATKFGRDAQALQAAARWVHGTDQHGVKAPPESFRLGGKASVGKGRVRLDFKHVAAAFGAPTGGQG